MNESGIGTSVRYWLHYNNLAQSFYKQYGAAKKVKDDYEKQIIGTLQQNGMEKATIQIGGGTLNVVERREPSQLSLTKVEDLLHGYFRQRGGKDETMDVMTYIKANRGHSINKYIKQSGITQNTGQGQLK
jgi:hypothetical protein